MKTVFITSFNPFILRNVLETDILSGISSKEDTRVVVFVPDYKKNFFEKKFKIPQSVIVGTKFEEGSTLDKLFSYFGRSLIDTSTLRIHRKEILLRNKKIHLFILSYLLSFVGRFKIVKRFFRFLDLLSIKNDIFSDYFDLYKPDIVLSTDVFNINDVRMLAESKRRDIVSIGMIRSWDNVTNKGLFRIKPNKLIVNNEVVLDEVLKYEDIKSEDIFLSGMPQLDLYINNKIPRIDRELFFLETGLDPNKKTIFVAPHGKRFFDKDIEFLEMLKGLPYQYIVRLPPNDSIDLSNFKNDKRFFIDHPGFSFNDKVFRDREITLDDTLRLADQLYYSDVVLNYVSSLIIDASFFDKPIINISFDGASNREYIKSERRFLDFTHLKKMVSTNCCKIAYSFNDLKKYLEIYLNNSEIDRDGRKDFLMKQAWKIDGKSGQKISDYILSLLN